MTKAVEKVKEVIKNNVKHAMCGIFDCSNTAGDLMKTIYNKDGVSVDICRNCEYFEVFGLTDEEFSEVESFYEDLISKCKKVTPIMPEISPVVPDYRIVHRKDGVYDLYDSLRWLMSRGCVDDILNFFRQRVNIRRFELCSKIKVWRNNYDAF